MAFFHLFSNENRFYYLTLQKLLAFWKRMEEGGRKSFQRKELDEAFYLPQRGGILVPYLDGIQLDLKMQGLTSFGSLFIIYVIFM